MISANLGQLPPWARELAAGARVGRIGLIDDAGRPRVLPVTFALHEGAFFTAVDEKRKRVAAPRLARLRYLAARPQTCLTLDHYEDDWAELAWLQALGRADMLDAAGRPDALQALCDKYEQYRERPPAGPLIRLSPERFVFWHASRA